VPQDSSSTDVLVYITPKIRHGQAGFSAWPTRGAYCSRKAVIGSSSAARRAGSHDATAEIAKKTAILQCHIGLTSTFNIGLEAIFCDHPGLGLVDGNSKFIERRARRPVEIHLCLFIAGLGRYQRRFGDR
jgi:hypothetical protein